MRARNAYHPLLLEPTYWRERLQTLGAAPLGAIWIPRPDLSGRGKEVMEFRIASHDGEKLWGLFARPAWHSAPWPALVRSVGPSERPCIDTRLVHSGSAEFVFQEPAGRRLADRVVDVMQACRLAMETDGIGQVEVETPGPEDSADPRSGCSDELLIADQLLTHRILPPK